MNNLLFCALDVVYSIVSFKIVLKKTGNTKINNIPGKKKITSSLKIPIQMLRRKVNLNKYSLIPVVPKVSMDI